jgi:hypothetical protein
VKTFHVYLHPARGYEAVQEGTCLPALCFNVLWLLFRGLVVPAAVITGAGALLVGAELTAGQNAVDDVQTWAFRVLMAAGVLVVWLTPFLYGNRWRHADLLRRGFAQVACLAARSGDDAIARALSLDSRTTAVSAAMPPTVGRAGRADVQYPAMEAPEGRSARVRQAEQGDSPRSRRGQRTARVGAGPVPELPSLDASAGAASALARQ